MPRPPLVSFLIDFDAEEPARPSPPRHAAPSSLPHPPVRDVDVLIAQALDKGRGEGWAAAEVAWEDKLRVEREQFQEQLASARAEWTRREAEALAQAIEAAFDAMQARFASALARTLAPFLDEAQRGRAVASLAEAVRTLADGGRHGLIEISAPEDLAAALRDRLGPLAPAVRFAPGEGPDVRVVADDTVIETRLEAWAVELAEAAGRRAT